MNTMIRVRLITLVATLAIMSCSRAQELEPRSYINVPIGMNFLIVGGAYQEGDMLLDPSLDVEDTVTRAKFVAIGYMRSFGVFGRSAKFSVGSAYTDYAASGFVEGAFREREDQGFSDPMFKLSVNLLGSPALTLSEYRDFKQDIIFGVSLGVIAPWGEYDSDKAINIGLNRWVFKPEIGLSKMLKRWVLEASAAVSLFTDNTEFVDELTREQDPLYSLQAHVVYRIMPGKGLWASFDATHYRGGQTTTEGKENDNALSNNRYGLTLSLPVNRHHSMKFYASTGVNARRGTQYDLIGLAWQFRWGGGL